MPFVGVKHIVDYVKCVIDHVMWVCATLFAAPYGS
jgi:hypothetical protein